MFSRWSGKVSHSSTSSVESARATETAETGTKSPTNVKLGRTISSALGFTISAPTDHEEASTSVHPTTTPYSSVNSPEGSTIEQEPGRMPEGDQTEIGLFHYPEAAPPKSLESPVPWEQASVSVNMWQIWLQGFRTQQSISRCWPLLITCHNSVPEKQ